MEKIRYPWATCFILVNTFFERFAFYGIRTTMSLYLRDSLGVPEKDCTIIYHAFYMVAYFTPLIGAIISDSYLGNLNTILLFTGIFTGGSILLTISAVPSLELPLTVFCVLGLILIATGTGGLKPCIATFSGDQFQLPQQAVQLTLFFGLFYWAGTAANLGATFLAPILRSQVSCFGSLTCYPLVFALSFGLILISFFVLLASKRTFEVKRCQETSLLRILNCLGYALKRKIFGEKDVSSDHWLDVSSKKYGDAVVTDLKCALKIMMIYIPFPLFATLIDQQGSKWIFQGSRMSGMIAGNYRMMPDQYQFITRVIVLILVPVLDRIVYPLLGKCNIFKQPLHRIFVSGLFSAGAFVAAGCIELILQRQSESELSPLHLIWQCPQYFLITVSEVIIVVTGTDFSYSEAPKSMKSLIQAIWLVTSAVGNLLVIIISKFNIGNDTFEYFMYAVIMFCGMLLFLWISENYISHKAKVVPTNSNTNTEESLDDQLNCSDRNDRIVIDIREQELKEGNNKS